MRQLLRKNLVAGWIWEGSLIGFAFLLSLLGSTSWFASADRDNLSNLYLIMTSALLGHLSFNADMRRHGLAFLEWLPVPRFAIWLANFLHGVAVLALICCALLWLQALVPPVTLVDPYEKLGLTVPLGQRWLGLFSVGLGFYTLTHFWRVVVRHEFGALVPMVVVPLVVEALDRAVLRSWLKLEPHFHENTGVALAAALFFAVAAAFAFVNTPTHTDLRHRLWRVGLPLFAVASLLALAVCWLQCRQWSHLSTTESLAIGNLKVLAGTPPRFSLEVQGSRSGRHLVVTDLDGHWLDLGRNLEPIPCWSTERMAVVDDQLLASSDTFNGQALFPVLDGAWHLWRLPLDGRPAVEIPANRLKLEATAGPAFPTGAYGRTFSWFPELEVLGWMEHMPMFGITATDAEESRTVYATATLTGAPRFRQLAGSLCRMNGETWEILSSPQPPAGLNLRSGATPPRPQNVPLHLRHVKSGQELQRPLSGRLVSMSSDLKAVVGRVREVNGRLCQTLLLCDLRTGEETAVLGEADLTILPVPRPAAAGGPPASDANGVRMPVDVQWDNHQPAHYIPNYNAWARSSEKWNRYASSSGPDMLWFDPARQRVAWLAIRLEDGWRTCRLTLLDLATGARQLVAGPETLPRERATGVCSVPAELKVFGFSRDGRRFRYGLGPRLLTWDVAGVTHAPALDLWGDLEQRSAATPQFKWSGLVPAPVTDLELPLRVTCLTRGKATEPDTVQARLECFRDGAWHCLRRWRGGFNMADGTVFWVDARQLVLWDTDFLMVVNVETGQQRQLFPPPY